MLATRGVWLPPAGATGESIKSRRRRRVRPPQSGVSVTSASTASRAPRGKTTRSRGHDPRRAQIPVRRMGQVRTFKVGGEIKTLQRSPVLLELVSELAGASDQGQQHRKHGKNGLHVWPLATISRVSRGNAQIVTHGVLPSPAARCARLPRGGVSMPGTGRVVGVHGPRCTCARARRRQFPAPFGW